MVLSGIYIALSVVFAFYMLKECAFIPPQAQSGFESPYELYEQCTPATFWIGCGVWLIPLLAALYIFVRSAIGLLRHRSG